MPPGRVCQRCGVVRSPDEFYKDRTRPSGIHPWCKWCAKASQAVWRRNNQDEIRTKKSVWSLANKHRYVERASERRHLREYGITTAQRAALFASQSGLCANTPCGRSARDVDHNHKSGAVRALLCRQCNVSLGLLAESQDRILGLAAYLEAHSA